MTDTLHNNNWLRPGESLRSSNGFHVLAMQEDGNLVLYSLAVAVWNSGTVGQKVDGVVMQGDGNLVIYAPGGKAIWATGTDGRGPSRLVLQDDRNAVVYSEQGYTWASNTSQDLKLYETHEIKLSPELRTSLQNDLNIAPTIEWGVSCTVSGTGVWVCVAVLIVIAVILEFTNGKPPFGENNDLRVAGGEISDAAKEAGRELSNLAKNPGAIIPGGGGGWFPPPPFIPNFPNI